MAGSPSERALCAWQGEDGRVGSVHASGLSRAHVREGFLEGEAGLLLRLEDPILGRCWDRAWA